MQRAVKNKKDAFKGWQKTRQDTSLKAEYKKVCKETKSRVLSLKQNMMPQSIYMMNWIQRKDR